MKNRIIKIFIMLFVICIVPIRSWAGTAIDDIISDGDNFLTKGKDPSTVMKTTNLKSFSDDVYNMILSIGMVIAVAVGTILGIKFMISPVDEKAKIKEILVVYGVGCAVLFGAFTIWKIVVQILGNV